jgi:hypothetical protein
LFPHAMLPHCCAPIVRFNSRPPSRAAPLAHRAGSHPSHESCGMGNSMVSHGAFVRDIGHPTPRTSM